MSKKVTITIDGKAIEAFQGETVLEAALRNDIQIPNMCYEKNVSHAAACRLCVVQIEGFRGMTTSCTTPVAEGMKIVAFSDEIEAIRKMTLDMTLSMHNDDCISCTADGACELQDLAFRYSLGKQDRTLPVLWKDIEKTSDYSSQVVNYDATKCIQCGRCIRACEEMQGKGVLSFISRGIGVTVGTGFDQWKESPCDGCGSCIQICPVGALSSKQVYGPRKRIRKKDIEKTVRTTCPYCGVGCQLDVGIRKNRIISVQGADSVPNFSKTCVKGRFGLDFVDRPDRLTKPLIKKNNVFVEAEWDEAIDYTAKRLSEIKAQYGAEAIAGLSSARCTNEENFVFQKFIRTVIGTNNVDHCARLCHASTVAGLAITLGSGAMTNTIAELEHAEVILVTGSNTTETHPVISTYIKKAVLQNNAKLIVVDPRRIDLVRYATLWLRQNSGTDIVWINGLLNIILAENLQNTAFIEERTENFEAMKAAVAKYTPELVEKISGIPAETLREAARLYATAKTGSIIYAMGITQHSHGTDNVKSLANLAMVTGQIGRESTGVNPLRGQNNVQGACDMGALPNVYPGYQAVTDELLRKKFEAAWGVSLSPKVGLTVTEMTHGACKGDLKAMILMGENPMVSDPNINHVKESLKNLQFMVCLDIFMTETSALADVIFPAASFAEKDGTFVNTERRVLPINPLIPPVGESKADWETIQLIAQALGAKWSYTGTADILKEINTLVPQYGGITPERLKNGELLQWPCPTADHPGTPFLHKDKFARGKGLFSAIDHIDSKELPDADYPFVLITGRILAHYHTGTMTRKTKILPEYVKDAYIEMSPEDTQALHAGHGDWVRVTSRRGTIELAIKETNKVPKGSVFIPFHFAEAAANMLTNDVVDPIAKIPELKVCAVKIEKV